MFDVKKAITVVIRGEFEDAAAAFNVNPTGDNWRRLLDAMWARQALTSTETMAIATDKLRETGVGYWVSELRSLHEGKKEVATVITSTPLRRKAP